MHIMNVRSTTTFQKDDNFMQAKTEPLFANSSFLLFTSLQRSYTPKLSLMSEATTNKHTSCTSVLQRTSTEKRPIAKLTSYRMHK